MLTITGQDARGQITAATVAEILGLDVHETSAMLRSGPNAQSYFVDGDGTCWFEADCARYALGLTRAHWTALVGAREVALIQGRRPAGVQSLAPEARGYVRMLSLAPSLAVAPVSPIA